MDGSYWEKMTSICYSKVLRTRLFICLLLLIDIVLLILFIYNRLKAPGNTKLWIVYLIFINFVLILGLWVYLQIFFYKSNNDCRSIYPLAYWTILAWIISVSYTHLTLPTNREV
eukprot:TRINITY_DN3748_c0_g1_i22.p2 TRINITY_DN3748_c0_g1~~TRINITY_DN3748_c0_g1_i22.p2  ORF type:complete len:114 (+),score=18.12 TRINITY_DN3748_c0_g1_i22:173-514(+)